MLVSNESHLAAASIAPCPEEPGFAPGTLIDNTYRIEQFVAAGSVGQVYLCSHCHIEDAQVALKVLSLLGREKDEVLLDLQRFQQEIGISFKVNHPNVIKSYSFVEHEDYIALAMEYMEEGDLRSYLKKRSRISLARVLSVLSQACAGLQAIHDAGVVHRDVKPENFLLDDQGVLKVADFGISRSQDQRNLTPTGSLLGTMQYLSPEYLQEGLCDARSDIYALGLIGYEMLIHEDPFDGDTLLERLQLRMRSELPLAHRTRSDCPEALSRVLRKAAMPKPEDRYQSAREMLADLRQITETLNVSVIPRLWSCGNEFAEEEFLDEASKSTRNKTKATSMFVDARLSSPGRRQGVSPQTLLQRLGVFSAFLSFWLIVCVQYLL